MNTETNLQRQIMAEISHKAAMFRTPAGLYWQGDRQGDTLVNIRPVKVTVKGYPDLTGWRRSDGRFVAIEVKTDKGRPTKEQLNFIEQVRNAGGLAGIARSAEDALRIVEGDL